MYLKEKTGFDPSSRVSLIDNESLLSVQYLQIAPFVKQNNSVKPSE